MAWCFADEDDDYAERVFDHLEQATAVVPAHWPLEVANVMLVALRRGRIDDALSDAFRVKLRQLPIKVMETPNNIDTVFDLGRRYALTSYDAAYLDLAIRETLPLATSDLALRSAARKARLKVLTP
jgi:predicted nucleic acid-binding protein